MADKSVPQVAATLIVVCLVVHTAICVQPGQVGSSSSEGDEFRKGIDEMLGAMDRSVNPCIDFYKYACGNWPKRHPIPDLDSHTTTVTEMRSNLNSKLKGLLEKDISPDDGEAIIKAKTLYRSCMDESAIDRIGPEPLLRLINNELGGWPLLGTQLLPVDNVGPSASTRETIEESARPIKDWVQLMGTLRTFGDEIIIGQTVEGRRHDFSQHVIKLYPATLAMPSVDHYKIRSEQFKAYSNYLTSTAKLLNANNINLEADIVRILRFERSLAGILLPQSKVYNQRLNDISKLQPHTPALNWHDYLRFALPNSGIDLSSDIPIDLYEYKSIKAISNLINITPEKTVINYLLWRFVMNRMDLLGRPFAELKRKFEAIVYGIANQAPRHNYCVDFVNDNMGIAVSSLYVNSLSDSGALKQVKTMVHNIKVALIRSLDSVAWMDTQSHSKAAGKVIGLLQNIGFPDWIKDPIKVAQEYQHLNLSPDNFFGNVFQIRMSNARKDRSRLISEGKRDEWTVLASTARVSYTLSRNLINLSAGIMQPPLFHSQYLKSMNYGGLGTIIGSEISNGFNQKGQYHNAEGKNYKCWSKDTTNKFLHQTECLVNRYNTFLESIGAHIGDVDAYDALADHVSEYAGVKVALWAYNRLEWEDRLGGIASELGLTNYQVFFIKYAQNWCQNLSPQSIRDAYRNLPSPVGRFRVMTTLSNLDEFSYAFGCPADTPMNPSNKCKVW